MLKSSLNQGANILKHGRNTFKFYRFSVSSLHTSKVLQTTTLPELDSSEVNVVDKLYSGLLSSNRACLAQSITLIESTHARKRLQAQLLLQKALQYCKQLLHENDQTSVSFRIGRCKFYLKKFQSKRSLSESISFYYFRVIRTTWSRKINFP